MDRIVQAFTRATTFASAIGVDFVELHAAHGYLMHSFLSPVSNHRSDHFGGSIENRMRFPLAIVREVRRVWPQDKTIGVRINGTDWLDGGWSIDDAITFAACLIREGVNYLSVSSGGVRSGVPIKLEPGYQVPLATAVRQAIGCPVICAGLVADARHAESIVANQQADFVALARAMLDDPNWPIHAAGKLGGNAELPHPYQLAAIGKWPLATTKP
jgi:2,4-dienoyl-CoA reductase-like NADH-dependent reductase (Old Yellow Enzyme family)